MAPIVTTAAAEPIPNAAATPPAVASAPPINGIIIGAAMIPATSNAPPPICLSNYKKNIL